jgi:hypothetical protein
LWAVGAGKGRGVGGRGRTVKLLGGWGRTHTNSNLTIRFSFSVIHVCLKQTLEHSADGFQDMAILQSVARLHGVNDEERGGGGWGLGKAFNHHTRFSHHLQNMVHEIRTSPSFSPHL